MKSRHSFPALIALLAILSPSASAWAHTSGQSECNCGHNGPLIPATILQVESVRQAAGRFFDVQAALDAGYIDISLYYPHMGWHFLNPNLLDDHFDPKEPELLVYQENEDGSLRLAAVEYAVPTELTSKPPSGFIGDGDVWTINATFKLWTLHAWVYDYNPDGVFASHNHRFP